MDMLIIAMLIAIAAFTFGFFIVTIVKFNAKFRSNNKLLTHICDIFFAIGLGIWISFLVCVGRGKHHDSTTEYKEYPIEKVTLGSVYFDGRGGDRFNESYVTLEDPSDKYENVVIKETEHYTLNWLFKIRTSSSTYHVYLSKEVYKRFQDGSVIYRRED